jgi:drug/metabolite transporter (DMT)-like permease
MKLQSSKKYMENPFHIVMLFSLSWALQIFITKLGFNAGAQVLVYHSISILVSLLILAIVFGSNQVGRLRELFRKNSRLYWKLFFANGIQSGLGTWLSIIGISLTAAINAGFLVKMAAVTTVIFAWLILKERLTLIKVMMVIIMLAGAYLLTTNGEILVPRIGDLFILSACVCWSLGNVLIRKYLQNEDVSIELITLQKPIAGLPVIILLAGIVAWFPNSPLGSQLILPGISMPPLSIYYAIGNGVILTLTWTFLNQTLKVTTASYMTMMSMATPIFVSLLAVIFLQETLEWIQLLGAGLIIMAGVVTYLSEISVQ